MKSIILSSMFIIVWVLCGNKLLTQDAENIMEKNKSALVSIWSLEDADYNEFKKGYSFDTLVIWGSGFFVSPEGWVGTCYHVISGIDSIFIKTAGGEFLPGKVISVDTVNDLALLQIQNVTGKEFPYVMMGNSDEVKTGEIICTIGNPLGYEYTISQGIVSGIRDNAKEFLDGKEVVFDRVIQTDAAVSPGNSGGAFFNAKGEVIGITSYNYLSLGNLNFGVAINCLKALMDKHSAGKSVIPELSKGQIDDKIDEYLEIANSLKRELRCYDLPADSSGRVNRARPKPAPYDTALSNNNIDQDSLNRLFSSKAEFLIKKCIQLDSMYFDAYEDFIDYYLKVREPDKAYAVYRNAQNIFLNDKKLEYLMRSLEGYYVTHKNIDKIKELYGITKTNNSSSSEQYYRLGLIYDKLGDRLNAVSYYLKALEKDSKYYKASFQLGIYYYKEGNYSHAKELLSLAYENSLLPDISSRRKTEISREDTYSEFELNYYLGLLSLKEGNKLSALINYIHLIPGTQDESKKAIHLYEEIIR